ncbi:MAG: permease [Candidatus Chloroheliales bacterium]|nr:MAG: permease [Chloroflexota bacterium]
MSLWIFLIIVFATSLTAGLIGALVGIGGGILIVPLLTIGFGIDIKYAIGASIVCTIATSSGAAVAYLRDHIINLRAAMFLEVATTVGAITGAFLTGIINPNFLYILFGAVMTVSAAAQVFKFGEELPRGVQSDKLALRLKLPSEYPDKRLGLVHYNVTRVPLGFGIMYVAGVLSGLLGIGSGVFKVLAMDSAMRMPMKVSSTTSNFMIGVTAAASAGVYLGRGNVNPLLVAPVAIGVLGGALLGSRILPNMTNRAVRKLFVPILLLIAAQMILKGFGVSIFGE